MSRCRSRRPSGEAFHPVDAPRFAHTRHQVPVLRHHLPAIVALRQIAVVGATHQADRSVVTVPDERLDKLAEMMQPKKVTHATIELLDLPGLSFADESGRHEARRIVAQGRQVDMLVWVIRGFDNDSVAAYRNRVDPAKDMEELKNELLLADLELVANRIEKLKVSITKPTRESLFTVVPREEKYQAKNVIDTVVHRGADTTGTGIVSVLHAWGMGLSHMAFAAMPIAMLWIGAGGYLYVRGQLNFYQKTDHTQRPKPPCLFKLIMMNKILQQWPVMPLCGNGQEQKYLGF